MEKRQIVWLFILLTFCTGYIFSFSLLGEQAFERAFASNKGFTEGTIIGAVDVSHLSEQEALDKLQAESTKWADETTINLQYKEKSIELNNDSFIFLLEKSINLAKSGVQNQFIIELLDETIDSILVDFGIPEANFNKESFIQEAISYPSRLEKGIHMIKLDEFMLEEQEIQTVSETSVSLEDNSEQLELWLGQFPSITIAPHSQFSMLDSVEESGIKTFTSEGLSMIATAIYQAVLPTNFQIAERSISRSLPSYAKAGYEAKVDMKQNMDLVISNVTDYEYKLEFKQSEGAFTVSLIGPPFLYGYKMIEKDLETFKPKNILQYDAKLELGQQVVRKKGQDGLLIKIYREILDENGALLNRELISEDYYPPVHTVVATSLIAEVEEQAANGETQGTTDAQNNGQAAGTVSPSAATPQAPAPASNVAPDAGPVQTTPAPAAGNVPTSNTTEANIQATK